MNDMTKIETSETRGDYNRKFGNKFTVSSEEYLRSKSRKKMKNLSFYLTEKDVKRLNMYWKDVFLHLAKRDRENFREDLVILFLVIYSEMGSNFPVSRENAYDFKWVFKELCSDLENEEEDDGAHLEWVSLPKEVNDVANEYFKELNELGEIDNPIVDVAFKYIVRLVQYIGETEVKT